MKTFKTVEEWMGSNPSQETTERVLNTVNRGQIAETRKLYYAKRNEYNKLQKVFSSMAAIQIEIPKELIEKGQQLTEEVEALKKQLPVIKKKEVKEEK